MMLSLGAGHREGSLFSLHPKHLQHPQRPARSKNWQASAGTWDRSLWISLACGAGARRAAKLPRHAGKDQESDHWSVLGVSPGASPSEVRTAFRAKARRAHPDALGGDSERFYALSQAYAKAMKIKEGREETDGKAAKSSKPARSQAPPEEKKEPTLEDFLQWRRKQQSRQAARRAATPGPRSGSRGSPARSPHASSSVQQGRLQDAVRQAENPELEAAWLREVDMESLRMERSKKRQSKRSAKVSKRSAAPAASMDERVGYRSVRSPSGTVTVPIFQSAEGARYYMSPFTSKRVAIP